MSGKGATIKYQAIENGLRVGINDATCDAKFGAAPCQLANDGAGMRSALRRLSERRIEQVLSRGDKILSVAQIAVADDGRSMTMDTEDRLTGRTVRSELLLVGRP
jgi:hypothetical protein